MYECTKNSSLLQQGQSTDENHTALTSNSTEGRAYPTTSLSMIPAASIVSVTNEMAHSRISWLALVSLGHIQPSRAKNY